MLKKTSRHWRILDESIEEEAWLESMSSKKDGQHKLALFMSSKKDGQHKLALFGEWNMDGDKAPIKGKGKSVQ